MCSDARVRLQAARVLKKRIGLTLTTTGNKTRISIKLKKYFVQLFRSMTMAVFCGVVVVIAMEGGASSGIPTGKQQILFRSAQKEIEGR